MVMPETTLLTGADGYLGGDLARAILASSDQHLVLPVNGLAGDGAFEDKCRRLDHELGPIGRGRITIVPADLRRRDALADVDPRRIDHVVHAAAVTRFNVEYDEARAANVEGTARVADFAARCDRLQRLTIISTLYAAGRRSGDVPEERLGETAFVNHYEWSKWACEDYVLRTHGDLPCSVLRLPTIVAEDDTGQVIQQNAFHNTLKLYYYGLLSVIPGDRITPINIATAEFAISGIMHLLDLSVPAGIYHVCPGPESVTQLGTLLDTVFDLFDLSEDYRRRKLPRPLYCDEESFYDLVAAASTMRGGPIYQGLMSVAPFARQLFLAKDFRNDALRAAWPGYKVPEPLDLVRATINWLVATRWGRIALEKT
jgi:nucleoside-diphosphate-sugar epimerase